MFSRARCWSVDRFRAGSGSPRHIGLLLAGLLIATLAFAPSALACEDTITAGGAFWEEGSSWSARHPPTAEEEACIEKGAQIKIKSAATAANVQDSGAIEIEEGASLAIARGGNSYFYHLSMFPGSSLSHVGRVEVSHEFLWSGPGKISGSSEMVIHGRGELNDPPSGTLTLEGTKLVSEGYMTDPEHTLLMTDGAQLINAGTFRLTADPEKGDAIESGEGAAPKFIT